MTCVKDTGSTCLAVDSTKGCTLYTTINQCAINYKCRWTAGSTASTGNCATHVCGDYKSNATCIMIMTSMMSATACKWSPSTSAMSAKSGSAAAAVGTCVNGLPTDISKAMCQSGAMFYYTWSDPTSACTACTDTMVSKILQNFVLMMVMFATLFV